jgi:hypothetical protein
MNFANNNILLILISLVFIYAVLSILVSILTEWLNHAFKARGIFLKDSIYKLLKDPQNKDYGYLFYNHVTISGLKSEPDRSPQYISSRMFAEVLIDIISQQALHNRKIQVTLSPDGNKQYQMADAEIPTDIMKCFQMGVDNMNPSPFTDLMQSFINKSKNEGAEGDYSKLKTHIEQWFNDYMDRVSGWYKTKQRRKFLVVGFVVAISLNVDSLHLLKVLSLDDDLKNRLVASAEQTVDNLAKDSTLKDNVSYQMKSVSIALETAKSKSYPQEHINQLSNLLNRLETWDSIHQISDSAARQESKQLKYALGLVSELDIPIGWSSDAAPISWTHCEEVRKKNLAILKTAKSQALATYINNRNNDCSGWSIPKYLIGIIISGVSLSFGAPFWFDILAKFVNIRRSGKVPEENKSKP